MSDQDTHACDGAPMSIAPKIAISLVVIITVIFLSVDVYMLVRG